MQLIDPAKLTNEQLVQVKARLKDVRENRELREISSIRSMACQRKV